jgi:hypothetical protein
MTTTQLPKSLPEGENQESPCRHHWAISTPDGPVSMGECRLCGSIQEFKNFLESSSWSEDTRDISPQEEIRVTIPKDYGLNDEE